MFSLVQAKTCSLGSFARTPSKCQQYRHRAAEEFAFYRIIWVFICLLNPINRKLYNLSRTDSLLLFFILGSIITVNLFVHIRDYQKIKLTQIQKFVRWFFFALRRRYSKSLLWNTIEQGTIWAARLLIRVILCNLRILIWCLR